MKLVEASQKLLRVLVIVRDLGLADRAHIIIRHERTVGEHYSSCAMRTKTLTAQAEDARVDSIYTTTHH
jgi:hypothetical protein